MATSPEKRIEAALITQISALAYMATNSTPVRSYDDMTKSKAGTFVTVHCDKASKVSPNHDYYRAQVEITCVTHIPGDENSAVMENLYDSANNYVQGTVTAATLTTAINDSEITVDGLVPGQNDVDYDENMRMMVVRMECFYSYTNA